MDQQLKEKLRTREKLISFPWIATTYYKHPDGQDLGGKLLFVTKWTAVIGATLGALNVSKERYEISFPTKCLKFSAFFFPVVGLGITYTCVAYFSTVLRQKDDKVNHAWAGAAAGILLGPLTGCPATGAWGAAIGALCSAIVKGLHMNNMQVFGNRIPRCNSSYYLDKIDFSLMPEKKGNWTR